MPLILNRDGGNVGIGTDYANTKLYVNGDLTVTTDTDINGILYYKNWAQPLTVSYILVFKVHLEHLLLQIFNQGLVSTCVYV